MFDALLVAVAELAHPWPIFLMCAGVLGGSISAALPGIGGLLLLSVILPFAITLDPYPAIALLLGLGAVSNTANTFPSVLIAVPGSSGSQATIVDGFPMAQRGEAKRAFGAAFTASPLGGIIGALVLFASLPILKPLVLSFGSPEFLMLVIWGLSAVGVLSGNAPAKGLIAAIVGILFSTVGMDGKTGIERFSFGGEYLVSGISIVLVGLGLFAVPEMIALSVRRTSIAQTEGLGHGLWQGVRDVFRNWWLVIRCSIIGVWVGFLPGLGSSVADWFAYAHAAQTEKDTDNFGHGDVRGVIAPESSNNAKEGGALIPTIAFGIPGSVSLALMMVAFIGVGIIPGSAMLTDQLPYTMAMIVVLVVANLVAAGLALGASAPFARLSLMPFYIVVPMTLVLCISASFVVHFSLWDIVTFLGFSVLGYLMKLFDWPRPPLLVAVVLGSQLERYLWLSHARYGWSWLLEPGVIAILALVVLTLAAPVYRRLKTGRGDRRKGEEPLSRAHRVGDIAFIAGLLALLLAAAKISGDWGVPRASLVIFVLAAIATPLAVAQVAAHLRALRGTTADAAPPLNWADARETVGRTAEAFAWLAGLAASVWLVGFHVTLAVYPVLFIRFYGGTWRAGLVTAILAEGFIVVVFDMLLNVFWPTPILLPWLN